MADTCTTDPKTCTGRSAHYCALAAMVGSGAFLFLSVTGLLHLANLHFSQGQPWTRPHAIDASIEAAVAVFAMLVLVDAVRSFREGTLRLLAFFGVLMTCSMVLTMVLFYLFLQLLPKFA